jgi:hypothetical protein
MAKEDKTEKKEKKAKEKKTQSGQKEKLPYYLDFSLSVSQLVVVLLGILTAGISFFSGASLLAAVGRGCAATISLGLVTWTINWYLARNGIIAVHRDLILAARSMLESDKSNTVDYEA